MAATKNEVAKSSAWLLEKAQNAANASGTGPEAVAKILQKAKEQKEANNEEHQKRMGLLSKKMTDLRAKHEMNPFKNAEQPPLQKADKPKKLKVNTKELGKAQAKSSTPTPIQKKPQEKDSENRSNPSSLPCKMRKQREPLKDEQKQPPKDEPKSATFAESSTADASRERTAATTSRAATSATSTNASDSEIVPFNDLFISDDPDDKFPIAKSLPSWYASIHVKDPRMEAMTKKRPLALVTLQALKAALGDCEKPNKSPAELEILYDKIRDLIHKAEIDIQVSQVLLRKAMTLSPDYGLPRIFKPGTNFPWDLKADAYRLYKRWYKCDLNQDILRGIVPHKGDNRTSDRLDDTYRAQFPTTPKYYGEGELVLGQWWPTQLCTVRDGAHGSAQGGIYGERDKGAYSIVLSGGNPYHDVDNGGTIEYSGTEGRNSIPTENTLHLLKSAELVNPIRVIRSAQLNKKNPFRPELGLRYDGLYIVRGYTLVDREKAMYRFRLERCEGQEGIRWQGKGRRPTEYECREFRRLKDKGVGVSW
ncbi:PUA-like domain-containing protein [Alternaria rosae]|uniref:PUA-like domain-containing protein n=1 Tax=Alternaria rosae TaxID=1187941 RepID=UPI001E8D5107|nr:PUA-like domain-containing protein [Alternaria rosae]KAH6852924.1 PUA-like domain-containing protein [Alternaria rosae]